MRAKLATLALATAAALGATTLPSRAADPTVVGLWEKVEQGRPVVWFLFVERPNNTFEGAVAKAFPRPNDPPNRPARAAPTTGRTSRCSACP